MTPEDCEAFRRQVAESKAAAEVERQARRAVAAKRAAHLWKRSKPAPEDHPYLVAKQVKPHGLRAMGPALVVPMRDGSGALYSLQFIRSGGEKRFIKEGRAKDVYHAIGGKPAGVLLLCEGYATGASIHQATGHPVAVAFNAGNLLSVARTLRKKYPQTAIIVCADDDYRTEGNPGLNKGRAAADAVKGKTVAPDFGPSRPGGATDFNDMARHRGLDAVAEIINRAAVDSENRNRVHSISIGDFLAMSFPPRQNLLDPWLPRQGLVMIYAYRGIGKTYFALCTSYAVACGGRFLRWTANRPSGVLYIDGEMPATVMQERLAAIVRSNAAEPAAPFILLTPDLQPGGIGMPRIDTEDGQAAIESVLTPEIELIVVDNISTLACAKENEADGWTPIQAWALRQRAAGRAVAFVHHAGKSGMQRGTSRREDVLDTVIQLQRPAAYIPSQGAVFEIHFEKARSLHGEDVAAIEAGLTIDESGLMAWTMRTLEASTFDKVVECLNAGMSQKETADALGVHKATVSRHAAKAQAAGLLTAGGCS